MHTGKQKQMNASYQASLVNRHIRRFTGLFIRSFIHSFIHSLIHAVIHCFTHFYVSLFYSVLAHCSIHSVLVAYVQGPSVAVVHTKVRLYYSLTHIR